MDRCRGFHDLNGIDGEGVAVGTAILPEGWRARPHTWDLVSSDPAQPRFLDPHDLAIAKLARLADKDRRFVDALVRVGMLDVSTLRMRAEWIPADLRPSRLARIHGFLGVCDGGAGRPGDGGS